MKVNKYVARFIVDAIQYDGNNMSEVLNFIKGKAYIISECGLKLRISHTMNKVKSMAQTIGEAIRLLNKLGEFDIKTSSNVSNKRTNRINKAIWTKHRMYTNGKQ